MTTMTFLQDFFSFILDHGVKMFSAIQIWCLYDAMGLRSFFALINTVVIAFSIPNILEKPECKIDKSSYIKSLFIEKLRIVRASSAILIALAAFTALIYFSLWTTLANQKICILMKETLELQKYGIYIYLLILLNVLTLITAYIAFNNKLFCIKHKQ
jgi:hypothetical protein